MARAADEEAGLPGRDAGTLDQAGSEYGALWRGNRGPGLEKATRKFNVLLDGKVDRLKASPIANLILFIAMPWVTFSVVMCPFALGYRHFHTLAWFVFALGLVEAGLVFVVLRQVEQKMHTYWKSLGYLCIAACLLGMLLGLYDYFKYVTVYHMYEASRFYQNTLPSQDPAGLMDAGMISFSADAFVDPSKSVGYSLDKRYCAAPVLSSAAAARPGTAPTANFWAVGPDCCHTRGQFDCGPVRDPAVRAGLRVLDASPLSRGDLPTYLAAVRQAAAVYGVALPEQPILVQWTPEPELQPRTYWEAGVRFYRDALGVSVAVVFACGLLAALSASGRFRLHI